MGTALNEIIAKIDNPGLVMNIKSYLLDYG